MFLGRQEKKKQIARQIEILRHVLDTLPPLGDPTKVYPVTLTEPEINAIHATLGYVRANIRQFAEMEPAIMKWWKHSGPTLEALSIRLAEFDD